MKIQEKVRAIDKINSFFESQSKTLYIISLILCVVFSFLLFQLKISIGADDSDYIMSSVKFLKGEAFPGWHGSFYQIFLSPFIWMFGINLFLLKLLSLFFIVLHLVIFRGSFLNKVPYSILSLSIIFISINPYILEFASLTYSEAIFFFVQIVCIYYFFRIISKLESEDSVFKHWKDWLVLGFVLFLLSITRNVGISMTISIVLFFAIVKNWKALCATLASFSVFQLIFSIYKLVYWGYSKIGQEDQFGAIFYKDLYKPELGRVNFQELAVRFFENFVQYISQHMLSFIGITNVSEKYSIVLSVIFAIIFIIILFLFFKTNKFMVFVGLYVIIAMCATFVSVHSFWNQGRLVLVYLPLVILFLFAGIFEFCNRFSNQFIRSIPIILACLLIVSSFANTITKVKDNIPVLVKNLNGDKYYGFTEDWINYFKISEWSAKNLPDTSIVGCRKPTMSFIYGNGRDFKGIFQAPSVAPDSFLAEAAKQEALLIINMKDVNFKLKPEDQTIFQSNIWAILLREKYVLGIIIVNETNKSEIFKTINKYNLTNVQGFDKLSKIVSAEKCMLVYPDSLIKVLKNNNISYLIDAKLKTGVNYGDLQLSISTIKHFVYFISKKYPDLFKVIKQEGDEETVCKLYKIQWEKLQ